jgi:hypothetical protein
MKFDDLARNGLQLLEAGVYRPFSEQIGKYATKLPDERIKDCVPGTLNRTKSALLHGFSTTKHNGRSATRWRFVTRS